MVSLVHTSLGSSWVIAHVQCSNKHTLDKLGREILYTSLPIFEVRIRGRRHPFLFHFFILNQKKSLTENQTEAVLIAVAVDEHSVLTTAMCSFGANTIVSRRATSGWRRRSRRATLVVAISEHGVFAATRRLFANTLAAEPPSSSVSRSMTS